MNRFLHALVATPLFFALVACSSPKLTEPAIATMLSDMTESIAKRDADALVSHFTPDATITVVMPPAAGGTMQLSVAQYKRLLVDAWKAATNHSYEVSDVTIELSPDGASARVTDTVRETLSMFGQRLTTTSSEQIDVILRDGKPRIISLTATVQ